MTAYTTFSVPSEKGARLREVARLRGKSVASLLIEIIDRECESAGIDSRTNEVRVQPHTSAAGESFVVTLFGLGRIELPRAGVESLAESLLSVAEAGGRFDAKHLDMDHKFRVYRQGSGVILECELFPMPGKTAAQPLKKSMSPDLAKAIAKELREATSGTQH